MIHRMVAIALDVANLAIKKMHLDPATAGAHVTGGIFDLIGNRSRELNSLLDGRHDSSFGHYQAIEGAKLGGVKWDVLLSKSEIGSG